MNRFLQLVRCLPLAVLLSWMRQVRSADGTDGPTFAEFRAACARLPKNRVLGGRLPPEELLPLPRFDVVGAELDRFFAAATNGPVGLPASWVGERPQAGFTDVTRSWFAGGKTPFEPFVRKLVLPPGSRLLLQGDLHGDIHSLLAVLGRLQEKGLMDGFRITDPAFQIAFLGDYTDRGVYGVEVIYTLLRLHRANPGRVHLVRGNHEDISLVSRYGFLAEGRGKYGREFDATKILRAYDFLPVALYLGQGRDFVQMCHGGMEPGYDPAALLASEGTNRFQLIGELRQVQYLRGNPDWLAKEPRAADEAQGLFRDFRPEAPTSPTVLGFMWNDFTVFGAEPAFANNPERAYIYGRPAVQQILRQAGGATARVHAVLRAHQHSGVPNALMRRLVASRGIYRHWQETDVPSTDTVPVDRLETTAVRGIPEGSVWTLNVVPDSVYGQGNGFTFATVILLDIGDTFASWRLNVDTVEVPVR